MIALLMLYHLKVLSASVHIITKAILRIVLKALRPVHTNPQIIAILRRHKPLLFRNIGSLIRSVQSRLIALAQNRTNKQKQNYQVQQIPLFHGFKNILHYLKSFSLFPPLPL
jgi:hypothetical protein